MTYRNTLIERTRLFESLNDEPVVLDYLQLRNRQCLHEWQMRRAEHVISTQRARASRVSEKAALIAAELSY